MSIPHISRSIGLSRLRTSDLKKFRSELKKNQSIIEGDSRREVLIQNSRSHVNFSEQNQDRLPPEWVDTYDKINEDLSKLEDKCKFYVVNKLKEIQSERMSIVFGDTSIKDREIELLIQQTTKLLKETEGFVFNLSKSPGSQDDQNIRKNIQRKLASRLKEITQRHKIIQKSYMDTVQPKIPDDYSDSQGGLFEEKENEFSEVAKVREEGINVLVNNISELALIFKELNMLVLDQGTILDRIDYNLTLSKENSKNAVKQLVSAQKSQNCTRAASCLLFLIVLIVLLLLLLIFKHF